jgi:hypothetical protein
VDKVELKTVKIKSTKVKTTQVKKEQNMKESEKNEKPIASTSGFVVFTFVDLIFTVLSSTLSTLLSFAHFPD